MRAGREVGGVMLSSMCFPLEERGDQKAQMCGWSSANRGGEAEGLNLIVDSTTISN